MSDHQSRPIGPIVAGSAFAIMIVTFGLFLSGRSKAPSSSPTIATFPSSPSLTPSKIPESPSPTPPPAPPPSPTAPIANSPTLSPASPSPSPASPAPSSPPIAINQSATIIDPPSNVRDQPDGEILCSLTETTQIQLTGQQGDWYQTEICGPIGFIHRSQIRLSNSGVQSGGVAQVIDPPSNVRRQPNGEVLCQIPTSTTIRISNLQGDWYQTDACGEPGFIHKSQLKF